MREVLEGLIRRRLSEAQWKVLSGLPSCRGVTTGETTLNAWLEDCATILEAFGFRIPQNVRSQGEAFNESLEAEATREQVDWVKSRLIAIRAESENADWLTSIRELHSEMTEHEAIFELESLARVELLEHEPETERLSHLRDILRTFNDQELVDRGVVSAEAMLGALKDAALGLLPVYLPGENKTRYVAYFASNGSMATFAKAVFEMAQRYGWWPAESSAFCLFGHVPEVKSGQAVWLRHSEISGLSRIVLSVDPSWSPDEVRELYRKEIRNHTKYPLRLSVKHLVAAWFAFGEAAGHEWPARYRLHCETFSEQPELLFASAKTFKRDAEKAFQKLLEPTFLDDEK